MTSCLKSFNASEKENWEGRRIWKRNQFMADYRRSPFATNHPDIQQILREAQHRWLRPAEICEILRNYKQFQIAPEPEHMPESGSVFLFDRKVLRYFRKDGHKWRKKKDGKTVKEAHERLKSGRIDVLHCYYAHGEDDENFQRRSYWMLEEKLSHIVLVHYRDVKGNKINFNHIKVCDQMQKCGDTVPNSEADISLPFYPHSYQKPTQTTDTVSMNSAHASEYEDSESVYNHQARSKFHSFLDVPAVEKIDVPFDLSSMSFSSNCPGKRSDVPGMDFVAPSWIDKIGHTTDSASTYVPRNHCDFTLWENTLSSSSIAIQSVPFEPPSSSAANTVLMIPKQTDDLPGHLLTNNLGTREECANNLEAQEDWLWPLEQSLRSNSVYELNPKCDEQKLASDVSVSSFQSSRRQENDHTIHSDLQMQFSDVQHVKQHSLNGHSTEEGLKKLDSFNRWMSKELGDVSEPKKSSSVADWDTIDTENAVDDRTISSQAHLDGYTLGPFLSQDQYFSIIDFSPNWVYVGSETKVLITGRFLKSQEEAKNCKWSCMFGEIEVPAEVIADGVLCCHAPFHKAGRVPFYVTCSNRVACSELHEFEYRLGSTLSTDVTDNFCGNTGRILMRFERLLCLSSICPPKHDSSNTDEISLLSSKISSLLKEDTDEWDQMLKITTEKGFSVEELQEKIFQKLLKEKLHAWLLQKAFEGGKGPSVLDKDGQGVLHFAAVLGYDWALEPTIIAGVNVNFRDVNGWTALHWAASCGRERIIASLIHLGAAPGAITDPTPKYPEGRTPADLASMNGHKGIAAYLAESALSAHLCSLNLDKQNGDTADVLNVKAVNTLSHCSTIPFGNGDSPCKASLEDSLAAVRNATQAAARIHQVFRVQSFQRKQLKEYGGDKLGVTDEHALSLVTFKTKKAGHNVEPVHAAATRIQNKFRSWKGRKEFLIIRQRIVKIQALVRGHQVRKNCKKIIWSVGIVEKVILRWRRKRSGLRGFKSETLTSEESSKSDTLSKEDDYDFLKEGRKQSEERSKVALSRVKSMLQYPEAREQYSRLRNVITQIQEDKAASEGVFDNVMVADLDDTIDLETLLDVDTFMSTT
ncbi:hypothetical protein K2173_005127 [Erythroxylum novogranatense]|uniref:CG-1 domain-containing protein n=1 Tax=Erythroxylum novogranatense TaxID=1862640 RepID=A0AAV8TTV4_9ROSI|nr:hypothetical protein K2173_005127 [Erythroxylum novogranatense]